MSNSGSVALATDNPNYSSRTDDAASSENSQESTFAKLSREAHLLNDGLIGGMQEGFKESVHDPGGTGLRLAGSVGIGLVLGAAQRGTGMVALSAEMLGLAMTGSFASDVVAPGRWSKICHAISDTYKSGENYTRDVKELQNSGGRFAFDTLLTMGVGAATAKVTQSALISGEPTLNDVLSGSVVSQRPELQTTIAGKTPLAQVSAPQLTAKPVIQESVLPKSAELAGGKADVLVNTQSKPAGFIKPQLRQLDDGELAALAVRIKANSDKGITPEMIAAARADINAHGRDPVQGLMQLMKDNRILAMGERHYRLNSHRDFAADLMPQLKQAGATHLALEIQGHNQHILDRFEKTGVFTKSDGQAIAGLLNDDSYVRLLKAAKDSGIKLVAVDTKDGYRDGHMARKIGDILDADPNNKVIFWVGSHHLERDYKFSKTAYDLLNPKYAIATVRDVIQDFRPGYSLPLFTATRDLTAATILKTSEASGIAGFPAGSTTYGRWDYVLLHPADVPSLETVSALKKNPTINRDFSSTGSAGQTPRRYVAAS